MNLKYNWKRGSKNIGLAALVGLAGMNYCSNNDISEPELTLEQYQSQRIESCKKEQGFTPTYTVQPGDSYERIAQNLDYCFGSMRPMSDPDRPFINVDGLHIDPQTVNYKPALLKSIYKVKGTEGTDLHPGDELKLDLSNMEW